MILSIILVVIFLSLLVLIHELGHFLAAKKFGLWVEEFGFGLPPRLWGKKIGETIYSLNWLPIGGFVKIYGEDREDKEVAEEIIIQSQISEEVISSANRGGQILTRESETDIFVGPGKNRSFNSLPAWKRMIILSAGVLMNFVFGWFVMSAIFMIGTPQALIIASVNDGSPAASAGIISGDRILSATTASQKIENPADAQSFIDFINSSKGKEVDMKINRDGVEKEIKVIPMINPPQGEGALGVGLVEAGLAKQSFIKSLWEGLQASIDIIKTVLAAIFTLIAEIFVGKANLGAVTGPVGIAKITNQAVDMGFIYLLQLLSLISLNLSVINILPFPALDGGRLLFLLAEKIKGSPLPQKFERYANGLGMAVLLLLMLLITIRDIASSLKM